MFSHSIKFILLWISLFFCAFIPLSAQTKLNNEVTLNVTVLDKKEGFIKKLTASDFEIFNGKKRQNIKSVIQEDSPVSIGILFDSSAWFDGVSLGRTETIDLIENSLIQFVEAGNPSNEYFISVFNEQSKIILDNTQDKAEALKTLEQLSETEVENNTAFYDALSEGIEKISAGRHQKRVLLLITHGADNRSKKRFKDVKRLLKQQNVIVYSISFITPIRSVPLGDGQSVLWDICLLTGGWNLIPVTEEGISQIFSDIAEELRNQYKITFDLESEKQDREWHELKVKLIGEKSPRRATLRTREGFYIGK